MSNVSSLDRYLFEIEDEESEDEEDSEEPEGTEEFTVDDAVAVLQSMIPEAIDSVNSNFAQDWEDAEYFFDGGSDVEETEGRSKTTATVFRDAVRSVTASLMRVFCGAERIVEYKTTNRDLSKLVAIQSTYVNDLFWNTGGYKLLLDICHDSLVKKAAITKVVADEIIEPKFYTVKDIPAQIYYNTILTMPDTIVISKTEKQNGDQLFYDVEYVIMMKKRRLTHTHVPLYEYFFSDEAVEVEDARVQGQRREVTYGQATALGLDVEPGDFDDNDPETDYSTGESDIRRGYTKDNDVNEFEADPTMRTFQLTECYAKFDLLGIGIPQIYRFWLGGTQYEYIDHERVDRIPYKKWQMEPIPDAFYGRSLFDIMREDQNTITSLLRAMVDNAHQANNHRLAVHDTMVNMSDVMSPKIGAPIRFRAPGMIQPLGIESTTGALMPMLQFLKQQSENKAGVTNAAMGLDPSALQSTDKEAVQNTIQLAQSVIEMIARNIAETGGSSAFRDLLSLSIEHLPQDQQVDMQGQSFDVKQDWFDPDLPVRTRIGTGNARKEQRIMALQGALVDQKEIVGAYGPDNPFVSAEQLYNTRADLLRESGIDDVGRYYTLAEPQQVQEFMAQKAQEAAEAQKNQVDPAMALIQSKQIEVEGRFKEKEMQEQAQMVRSDRDFRLKLIDMIMRDDFDRDKLAQELEIDAAKINLEKVNKEEVARIQEKKIDNEAVSALKSGE